MNSIKSVVDRYLKVVHIKDSMLLILDCYPTLVIEGGIRTFNSFSLIYLEIEPRDREDKCTYKIWSSKGGAKDRRALIVFAIRYPEKESYRVFRCIKTYFEVYRSYYTLLPNDEWDPSSS